MHPPRRVFRIVGVQLLSGLIACTTPIIDARQQRLEAQEAALIQQAITNPARSAAALAREHAYNQAMQRVSRSSMIIGSQVTNLNGDNLGAINDIVIDASTGQVAYVVVAYGGMWVIANKLFAIPWRGLRWQAEQDCYVLDLAQTTLASSPGFEQQLWPDSTNAVAIQQISLRQFYNLAP